MKETTDIALSIRTSNEEISNWDRNKIVEALLRETNVEEGLAKSISEEVEKQIFGSNIKTITTSLVRELVNAKLIENGLEKDRLKHDRLGVPLYDVEAMLVKPNLENANVPHGPEATNLTLAGQIKKEYALRRVFSKDVTQAHMMGDIHLHDLNMPDRPYTLLFSECAFIKTDTGEIRNMSMKSLFKKSYFTYNQDDFEGGILPDGYFVYDKNGWTKIKRVLRHRKNDKTILWIKTKNSRSILLTEDHPMIAETKEGVFPASHLTLGDRLTTLLEVPQEFSGTKDCRDLVDSTVSLYKLHEKYIFENVFVEKNNVGYVVKKLNAEEIVALKNKGFSVKSTENSLVYSKAYNGAESKKYPSLIKLTPEFCYFIGVFIAKGHYETNTISFTVGPEETEKVLEYLHDNNVEYSSTDKEDSNCKRIRIFSKFYHDLFYYCFHIGAKSRFVSLPEDILTWKPELAFHLLSGIIDGDGTTPQGRSVNIVVSSRTLINQIAQFLLVHGIKANTGLKGAVGTKRIYKGREIVQNYDVFYCSFNIPEVKKYLFSKSKKAFNIMSGKSIPFDGSIRVIKPFPVNPVDNEYIYDLTTESGTFYCNGILVHNCSGQSLEYVKKFGLNLPKSLAIAKPAKYAEILLAHMVKFSAALQCHYAGAIGWDAVNIFFAPFLRGMSKKRIKQLAQMLIFEFSQQAVARGGQSLTYNQKLLLYDMVNNNLKVVEIGEFVENYTKKAGAVGIEERYKAISFNRETGKVEFKNIYAVIKHLNNSSLYKIKTYMGQEINVTEDHGLFTYDSEGNIITVSPKDNPKTILISKKIDIDSKYKLNDTVDAEDIISKSAVIDNLNLLPVEVKSIEKIDYEEYVYDISVKDNENFMTYDGIFAHNSIFSDINLYYEIPKHFENTPAIGPGGKYTGLTYGDYAQESKDFVWALFEIYKEGDGAGRPFFWPKPNLHITEKFFKTPGHEEFLLHVCEVASKMGNPYFLFDRGDTAKISECCFHNSQKVLVKTSRGVRHDKIGAVCRGDYVKELEVFHKGNFRKAKPVIVNHDKFIEVTLTNGYNMIVTDNHICPIFSGEKEAKELTLDDYLPINNSEFSGFNKKENYVMGYFIGAYLGDGSLDNKHENVNRIIFSLSAPKQGVVDTITDFAKMFGAHTTIVPENDRHVIFVNITSSTLKAFIQEFVSGKYALEKGLHNRVYEMSTNFRLGIIDGFYATDGGNNKRMYTSSDRLVDDINALYTTLGMPINISTDERGIAEGCFSDNKRFVMRSYEKASKYSHRPGFKFIDGKYYFQIISLKPINYNSPIPAYCFEMEDCNDPYFTLANGIETHNCRLSFLLTDKDLEDAKEPWKMRFCALQNITLNLPRLGFKYKEEKMFDKLTKMFDLAIKAHLQKLRFIKKILALGDKGPLALLCMNNDGETYVRLEKMSYLIGMVGLNEMVEAQIGRELHESDEAFMFGLKVIAHLNLLAKKASEEHGLHFVLEQSPAEATSYRFARLDLKYYEDKAKNFIKGDIENDSIYYTNSTQLNISEDIDPIDRIEKEGAFHPLIEAGSLSHVWLGEKQPPAESIADFVVKIFKHTDNDQVAFSPEFTSCNDCMMTSRGLQDTCEYCNSENVDGITRITGYFSKTSGWNKGKLAELKDRDRSIIG